MGEEEYESCEERKEKAAYSLAAAAVLVSLHVIRPADVSAAAKKSVVSRDDGVWLFPLDAAFYDEISDWAGCSNNENGLCLLCGREHNSYGDPYHAGDLGHNGLDIAADYGSDVYASAPGTVYWVDKNWGGRGYTVVMEHSIGEGKSYYSIYQHLSRTDLVESGTFVEAGTVIAKTGNSAGLNTGACHLHFEILLAPSGLGKWFSRAPNSTEGGPPTFERMGWVTDEDQLYGMILNNPAVTNAAGFPEGRPVALEALSAHCGSVHYTFRKSIVAIGESSS
ncbi:MAG: M23 family metallopeptidase [Clostridiales bacterium]|nr:M23 family metallopeptidase [Clostridiales bacterium]